MRSILKTLAVCGVAAVLGGQAFAETSKPTLPSIGTPEPDVELPPQVQTEQVKSGNMTGCILAIYYDYAMAGQTIGDGFKTRITISIRTIPTREVKRIDIWEGEETARLTIEGVDYDRDVSQGLERFVTPFLEAARLNIQVMAWNRTKRGPDDLARIAPLYDKPCTM